MEEQRLMAPDGPEGGEGFQRRGARRRNDDPTGTVERVWTKAKAGLFGVLYMMNKTDKMASRTLTLALYFLSAFQVAAFPLSPLLWQGVPAVEALAPAFLLISLRELWTSIDFLSGEIASLVSAAAYFVSLGWVALVIGIALFCGLSFARNRFKSLWPLKVLRISARVTTTALFIPLLSTQLSIFVCHDGKWGSQQWQCFEGLHLAFVVLTLVLLPFLLSLTAIVTASFFTRDPASKSLDTLLHGRVQLLRLAVRAGLTLLFSAVGSAGTISSDGNLWSVRIITFAGLLVPAAANLLIPAWHYQSMCRIDSGTDAALVWIAFCALLRPLFDGDSAETVAFLLFAGVLPAAYVGTRLADMRLERIETMAPGDIRWALLVEVRARRLHRYLEQELAASKRNTIGDKHGFAARATRADLATLTTAGNEKNSIARARCFEEVEAFYRACLEVLPNSPFVHLSYAYYLQVQGHGAHRQRELAQLALAARLEPPPDLDFLLWQRRKQLEEVDSDPEALVNAEGLLRGTGQLSAFNRVALEKHVQDALQAGLKARGALAAFWDALRSPLPDLDRLHQIGLQYFEASTATEAAFNAALRLNARDVLVLRRYASFVAEVLGHEARARALLEDADAIEDASTKASKNKAVALLLLAPSAAGRIDLAVPSTGIFTLSLDVGSQLPIVQSITQAAGRMIGYSQEQMNGQPLPAVFARPCNMLILSMLRSWSAGEAAPIARAPQLALMQHRLGHAVPALIQLQSMSDSLVAVVQPAFATGTEGMMLFVVKVTSSKSAATLRNTSRQQATSLPTPGSSEEALYEGLEVEQADSRSPRADTGESELHVQCNLAAACSSSAGLLGLSDTALTRITALATERASSNEGKLELAAAALSSAAYTAAQPLDLCSVLPQLPDATVAAAAESLVAAQRASDMRSRDVLGVAMKGMAATGHATAHGAGTPAFVAGSWGSVSTLSEHVRGSWRTRSGKSLQVEMRLQCVRTAYAARQADTAAVDEALAPLLAAGPAAQELYQTLRHAASPHVFFAVHWKRLKDQSRPIAEERDVAARDRGSVVEAPASQAEGSAATSRGTLDSATAAGGDHSTHGRSITMRSAAYAVMASNIVSGTHRSATPAAQQQRGSVAITSSTAQQQQQHPQQQHVHQQAQVHAPAQEARSQTKYHAQHAGSVSNKEHPAALTEASSLDSGTQGSSVGKKRMGALRRALAVESSQTTDPALRLLRRAFLLIFVVSVLVFFVSHMVHLSVLHSIEGGQEALSAVGRVQLALSSLHVDIQLLALGAAGLVPRRLPAADPQPMNSNPLAGISFESLWEEADALADPEAAVTLLDNVGAYAVAGLPNGTTTPTAFALGHAELLRRTMVQLTQQLFGSGQAALGAEAHSKLFYDSSAVYVTELRAGLSNSSLKVPYSTRMDLVSATKIQLRVINDVLTRMRDQDPVLGLPADDPSMAWLLINHAEVSRAYLAVSRELVSRDAHLTSVAGSIAPAVALALALALDIILLAVIAPIVEAVEDSKDTVLKAFLYIPLKTVLSLQQRSEGQLQKETRELHLSDEDDSDDDDEPEQDHVEVGGVGVDGPASPRVREHQESAAGDEKPNARSWDTSADALMVSSAPVPVTAAPNLLRRLSLLPSADATSESATARTAPRPPPEGPAASSLPRISSRSAKVAPAPLAEHISFDAEVHADHTSDQQEAQAYEVSVAATTTLAEPARTPAMETRRRLRRRKNKDGGADDDLLRDYSKSSRLYFQLVVRFAAPILAIFLLLSGAYGFSVLVVQGLRTTGLHMRASHLRHASLLDSLAAQRYAVVGGSPWAAVASAATAAGSNAYGSDASAMLAYSAALVAPADREASASYRCAVGAEVAGGDGTGSASSPGGLMHALAQLSALHNGLLYGVPATGGYDTFWRSMLPLNENPLADGIVGELVLPVSLSGLVATEKGDALALTASSDQLESNAAPLPLRLPAELQRVQALRQLYLSDACAGTVDAATATAVSSTAPAVPSDPSVAATVAAALPTVCASFGGNLLGDGLHPALLVYLSTAADVSAACVNRTVPLATAAADAPMHPVCDESGSAVGGAPEAAQLVCGALWSPMAVRQDALARTFLTNGLRYAVTQHRRYLSAAVDSFETVHLAILVALAVGLLFFHLTVYQPSIRKVDRDLKRTVQMLLMLPPEALVVPAVQSLLARLTSSLTARALSDA